MHSNLKISRTVSSSEPSSYPWDLKGTHAAWAIMSALHGAAPTSPIRAWAGRSNDGDADSVFPSVSAVAGDMLLLSPSSRRQIRAGQGRRSASVAAPVGEGAPASAE